MIILFDDVEIDGDAIIGLSSSFKVYDNEFYLGSTQSRSITINVLKSAVENQPSTVKLIENGIDIANLIVDKIEDKNGEFYTYTLTDKMVNLEFYYDATQIFINGSTTLLNIALDICKKAGLELATQNFRGYDKIISWYDNTRTAREYIAYIAELNGGYAQIGDDGRLYFVKQNSSSTKTISINDCSDFIVGEKHKITRVVFEQGANKIEYGDETGNTLYLNGENVFINFPAEIEEIYNEIKNFVFYSFSTTNCPIDYSIKAGQVITFTDGFNSYPTIAGYELNYYGDWCGGYSLDIETKKQEETKVIGDSERIKNLRIIVDRQNNSINQVIEQVDGQNNKISQVQQTVNELNSKIGDIADITTAQETITGALNFEKINQSEPIHIEIRPLGENISYLYPFEKLFPADDLFIKIRTLRFTNTQTNEIFDYELPDDLLYYDNENYDEFILDYDSLTCYVNKKCAYNDDGDVILLDNEVVKEFDFPRIELTDGDYTVEILKYDEVLYGAYLFVRLMAQNIYTTQFATKAEVNSEINQTAREITSSVSETYETKTNATTNYSKLTQTANSLQSQISANDKDISTLTQTATSLQSQITSNDKDISTINQTVNEVSIDVGKKYNTSDFTNAKITAKINDGTSAVQISANKVSLAGKTINMTSDNIAINSTNFKVDKNGNMTCNNANISAKGGENNGSSNGLNLKVLSDNTYNYAGMAPGFAIARYSQLRYVNMEANSDIARLEISGDASNYISNNVRPSVNMVNTIWHSLGSSTNVSSTGISTPSVTQTSKAEEKKNFEKFENALDILKEIDIYKYNLKCEEDSIKKHIGFVIGENYKYSQEVTSSQNDGVDLYSFVSLCCQAIKEQQVEIENLKQRLEEKENGKN